MGQLAVITQISFKVFPIQENQEVKQKQIRGSVDSTLRKSIEQKLKNVFDPYGVFI